MFDEDDIERLLQELEGGGSARGGGSSSRKPQPPSGGRSHQGGNSSSPKPPAATGAGRVLFSTYDNTSSASPQGRHWSSSPVDDVSRAIPRNIGRLAPLGGSGSGGASPSSAMSPQRPNDDAATLTTRRASLESVVARPSQADLDLLLRRGGPTSGAGGSPAVNNKRQPLPPTSASSGSFSAGGQPQQSGSAAAGGPQMTPDDAAANDEFLPVVYPRFVSGVTGIVPKGKNSRWGHSLTHVVADSILLFGGVITTYDAHQDFARMETTNDLYLFDCARQSWEPCLSVAPVAAAVHSGAEPPSSAAAAAPRTPTIPAARWGHAAVAHQQRYLLVVGGTTSPNGGAEGLLAQIAAYDILTGTWSIWWESHRNGATTEESNSSNATATTKKKKNHDMPPLYGHTCVIYHNSLYVYGGKTIKAGKVKADGTQKAAKEILNADIFVFDLERRAWRKTLSITSPSAPAARAHHAACMVSNGDLVVNGGVDEAGAVLSDTWVCSLPSGFWRCVHPGGTRDAAPRSGHALLGHGRSVLAVGGCEHLGRAPMRREALCSVLHVGAFVGGVYHDGGIWQPLSPEATCVSPFHQFGGLTFVDGFAYLVGGRSTKKESTSSVDLHHSSSSMHVVRFLATDGKPTTDPKGDLEAHMERLLHDPLAHPAIPWHCDMAMIAGSGSQRCGAHFSILQQRAPQFLADVLQCRVSQTVTLPNGDEDDDTIPVFSLEGNRRVHGLSFSASGSKDDEGNNNKNGKAGVAVPTGSSSFSLSHLAMVLTYVYTGRVPPSTDTEAIAFLHSFAEFYGMTALRDNLPLLENATEEQRDAAALRRFDILQSDLTELLRSGNGATATILFVDPHTSVQTSRHVHPWIVAGQSELFQKLFRPLFQNKLTRDAPLASAMQDGVTARWTSTKRFPAGAQGAKGRRSITVGPVKIPTLSVDPILYFLYVASLGTVTSAQTEAAFPTVLGCLSLGGGLRRLRHACEAIVAREDVTYDSACSFMQLAQTHKAPLLLEMSLLTAAVGVSSGQVRKTAGFQQLNEDEKQTVEEVAKQLDTGRFAAPSDERVAEIKDRDYYERKMGSGLQ